MKKKIKNCKICGKQLPDLPRIRYCSEECRKKAAQQRLAKYHARDNETLKAAKEAAEQTEARPLSKPKLSIVEVENMARAAGLTFGRYVAKYGL